MKILAFLIFPLPSFLKVFVLRRLVGVNIGKGTRIGFSLVFPATLEIGARTRIGHLNIIGGMHRLELSDDVVVGHCNVILGGRLVSLGDGAMIGRFNEINSILNPLVRGTPIPELHLGRRSVVTAWHKIDFTDRVELGDGVVFAGRLSNIWTHNRQDIGPVSIGNRCYVGSGVQLVPGSRVGQDCVVGLGSVITKAFEVEGALIAGVPAKFVKQLDDKSIRLVTFPPRPDLDGYGDLSELRGE